MKGQVSDGLLIVCQLNHFWHGGPHVILFKAFYLRFSTISLDSIGGFPEKKKKNRTPFSRKPNQTQSSYNLMTVALLPKANQDCWVRAETPVHTFCRPRHCSTPESPCRKMYKIWPVMHNRKERLGLATFLASNVSLCMQAIFQSSKQLRQWALLRLLRPSLDYLC